jgi:hypothetical protein
MKCSFSHVSYFGGILFHLIRYFIMVLFYRDMEILSITFYSSRIKFPSSSNSRISVFIDIVCPKTFFRKDTRKYYECEKKENVTHTPLVQS